MLKAKYTGLLWTNRDGSRVLGYEYRGHAYDVTDYGWRGGEPLSWQHKNRQIAIDVEIEKAAALAARPAGKKPEPFDLSKLDI